LRLRVLLMAKDVKSITRSLGDAASEAARRWAAQRVDSVQRYGQILAAYGSGRASGRATAEAVAKLAAKEATRYPAEAFELWKDYVSAIASTAGVSIDSGARPAQAKRSVIDIHLTGALGGVATREFTLDNPHDVEAAIAFVAENFVGRDREVRAVPVFDPTEFSLPARSERKVSVSIKLDPRKFRIRENYEAKVAVTGFDDMVLRVHLTVVDPE
jgi:hypothetical protein